MEEKRTQHKQLQTEYEKIQLANAKIKTTPIKGKDYAEVNQRIKAFRMVHPLGRIETSVLRLQDGVCTMIAKVYDEQSNLLANGFAEEKENSTFINKTSYIENCQTSAIGRALGICGYGIDVSVASAEEVQNAIKNQEKEKEVKKASQEQVETIKGMEEKLQKWIMNKFKVNSLEELSEEQASWVIKKYQESKEKKEGVENGNN